MNAARAPVIAAATGFAALAAAMGIGRFAFTPLLPMMQAQGWIEAVRIPSLLAGVLLLASAATLRRGA